MPPVLDANGPEASVTQLKKILILAQVPPPHHGQAVMQSHLVSASWSWCAKKHIPLNFSSAIEDVGKFKLSKLFTLLRVVVAVLLERAKGPIDLLFFPPSGPHRIPFWRDVIILLLTRKAARKILFQFHAGGFDQLPSLLSGVERWLASRAYGHADTAIVLLPGLAREVAWISPKRVVIVPNGIEDRCGVPVSRQDVGVVTILFVGTVSGKKGVLDLLYASQILQEEGRKFRVRIVGGFSSMVFQQEATALREKLRLQSIVEFTGEKHGEEKWEEYRGADVFCFPSVETENVPVVLLEAMQAALPVVASRWRSIPDLVIHGENGLLYAAADPRDLAAQLRTLLEDARMRVSLGKNGRVRYEQMYSLNVHLAGMEKAFRETAGA